MASESTIDESVEIPNDVLEELYIGINGLPDNCDPEAKQACIDKLRLEQQALNAEQVRKFNAAWNIQQTTIAETPATMLVLEPAIETSLNGNVRPSTQNTEKVTARAETHFSSIGTTTHEISDKSCGTVPTTTNIPSLQGENNLRPPIEAQAVEKRRASCSDDEVDLIEERYGESRKKPRTRDRSCDRSRSRHGRRYSRDRSESPEYRRRRRRRGSNSRSRRRSRSYSRSRSRSRSSERRSRSRGSRDRSRGSGRSRAPDQTAMMQPMLSIMQMLNQAMAYSNRPPMMPMVHPTMLGNCVPTEFNVTNNQTLPANILPMVNQIPQPRAEVAVATNELHLQTCNEVDVHPEYDASTGLFLEGKLNFSDYLALKPSSRANQAAPINPTVVKRINEAISVLDQNDTKKQSARFLYVAPTYYKAKKATGTETQRSPLIYNDQNVLFRSTSNTKEAKLCQPFSNVNGKLKELIAKLGLDEGVISHQIEQSVRSSAEAKANDSGNQSTPSDGKTSSTTRIQAITALPPKAGSNRVRHVIERAVQTDAYSCLDCVARSKRVMVSSFTQTMVHSVKRDSAVQTSGPPMPAAVVSLDGLNPKQIATIEAIVHFVRTQQPAGSIQSVQHALRWHCTSDMEPSMHQGIQHVLSQVRNEQVRASSSSTSYGNYYHPQQQQPQLKLGEQKHYERPKDPRTVRNGGGRIYVGISSGEQLMPACFDNQPPLSRKTKKKLAMQQQLQHQQQHQQW